MRKKRKIKYIKLVPILLCVFCLTACQETENERMYHEEKILDEVTETGNVYETEDATLQETYQSKSESQEDMQLNEEETDLNENDSIESIKKFMIPEQSFDILLDDWGAVKFVSRKPSPDEYGDLKVASFYLMKDDKVLYKFPYRFKDNSLKGHVGIFDHVGAVAFRDINDDKKDDIIIITYYFSGAGPTSMVPRPFVTIYLAEDNNFCLAEDLITDVEDHIMEKDTTIESICEFLQHKG